MALDTLHLRILDLDFDNLSQSEIQSILSDLNIAGLPDTSTSDTPQAGDARDGGRGGLPPSISALIEGTIKNALQRDGSRSGRSTAVAVESDAVDGIGRSGGTQAGEKVVGDTELENEKKKRDVVDDRSALDIENGMEKVDTDVNHPGTLDDGVTGTGGIPLPIDSNSNSNSNDASINNNLLDASSSSFLASPTSSGNERVQSLPGNGLDHETIPSITPPGLGANFFVLPLILQLHLLHPYYLHHHPYLSKFLRLFILFPLAAYTSIKSPFMKNGLFQPTQIAIGLNFAGAVGGFYGLMKSLEFAFTSQPYYWIGLPSSITSSTSSPSNSPTFPSFPSTSPPHRQRNARRAGRAQAPDPGGIAISESTTATGSSTASVVEEEISETPSPFRRPQRVVVGDDDDRDYDENGEGVQEAGIGFASCAGRLTRRASLRSLTRRRSQVGLEESNSLSASPTANRTRNNSPSRRKDKGKGRGRNNESGNGSSRSGTDGEEGDLSPPSHGRRQQQQQQQRRLPLGSSPTATPHQHQNQWQTSPADDSIAAMMIGSSSSLMLRNNGVAAAVGGECSYDEGEDQPGDGGGDDDIGSGQEEESVRGRRNFPNADIDDEDSGDYDNDNHRTIPMTSSSSFGIPFQISPRRMSLSQSATLVRRRRASASVEELPSNDNDQDRNRPEGQNQNQDRTHSTNPIPEHLLNATFFERCLETLSNLSTMRGIGYSWGPHTLSSLETNWPAPLVGSWKEPFEGVGTHRLRQRGPDGRFVRRRSEIELARTQRKKREANWRFLIITMGRCFFLHWIYCFASVLVVMSFYPDHYSTTTSIASTSSTPSSTDVKDLPHSLPICPPPNPFLSLFLSPTLLNTYLQSLYTTHFFPFFFKLSLYLTPHQESISSWWPKVLRTLGMGFAAYSGVSYGWMLVSLIMFFVQNLARVVMKGMVGMVGVIKSWVEVYRSVSTAAAFDAQAGDRYRYRNGDRDEDERRGRWNNRLESLEIALSKATPPEFDPRMWPPLFNLFPFLMGQHQQQQPSPWTSLSRFWSQGWHGLFARPFRCVGLKVGMKIGEVLTTTSTAVANDDERKRRRRKGKTIGRMIGVMLVFFWSGMMHEFALLAATSRLPENHSLHVQLPWPVSLLSPNSTTADWKEPPEFVIQHPFTPTAVASTTASASSTVTPTSSTPTPQPNKQQHILRRLFSLPSYVFSRMNNVKHSQSNKRRKNNIITEPIYLHPQPPPAPKPLSYFSIFFSRTMLYFLAQGVGILIEGYLGEVLKAARSKRVRARRARANDDDHLRDWMWKIVESKRVKELVGVVWTVGWMVVGGYWLTMDWTTRGVGSATPHPTRWDWKRWIIPFAPTVPDGVLVVG